MVRAINRKLSGRFLLSLIWRARNITTATLANSAGWKDSGPSASHRLEPLYSRPTNNTSVDSSRDAP